MAPNAATKDVGPVSGESPGPVRSDVATKMLARRRQYIALRNMPQAPGLICRPRLRDPVSKSRKQNAGSGAPIPSRGLHGVLASPGNGRGVLAKSTGMTSGPSPAWIAPKKAIGRRLGSTAGGESRKGNEYAADQQIGSPWSGALREGRQGHTGRRKGRSYGRTP